MCLTEVKVFETLFVVEAAPATFPFTEVPVLLNACQIPTNDAMWCFRLSIRCHFSSSKEECIRRAEARK